MPNRKTFDEREKVDHSGHSTQRRERGDLASTPNSEPEDGPLTSPNHPPRKGSATPPPQDPKAVHEQGFETVSDSKPGGFKNDPNDPTSPNEAIERSRRSLRPPPVEPAPPRKK
jgi:hypothetical protein